MTTLKEVRQLVEPLLEGNGDLVLMERSLVLLPIRHLVRNIFIDRTRSADLFRPVPAIGPMFRPRSHLPLNYSVFIFTPGNWTFDNPKIGNEFVAKIMDEVLPIFRSVETVKDFDRYCAERCTHRSQRYERDPLDRIYLGSALGDFDDVEICLGYLAAKPEWWRTRTRTEADFDRMMDELRPLVRKRDRAGIGAFLTEIEATSAKSLGLEAYWQPSPFPVEETGD